LLLGNVPSVPLVFLAQNFKNCPTQAKTGLEWATRHDLVHVNGHAYDKLTVRDRQGKRQVVWFNTDTNELLRERALHPKDARQ
jgi:hypothetical protein